MLRDQLIKELENITERMIVHMNEINGYVDKKPIHDEFLSIKKAIAILKKNWYN